MIFAFVLFFAFWDLGAVKSEPDLDKRSELALVNADHEGSGVGGRCDLAGQCRCRQEFG